MDKKNKRLIWLIIILVLLGILFFALRLINRGGNVEPIINTNEPVVEIENKSKELEFNPDLEPTKSNAEFTALNLAKSYVARFGSWSTDNQGHNLEELIPLSSARMRAYLSNIEVDQEAGEFKGITTKSLSADIISMTDAEANIMVGTQRIETNADLQENVYYQDAEVILIKSGGKWLVDKVIWQ